MRRYVQSAYWLMLASLLSLITLLTVRYSWLAPPENTGYVAPLLLLLVGPLLIPLFGILRGRRYTAAWTSLLAVFYFVHGIASAANAGVLRWIGFAEILFSLGLFLGCLLYVRTTSAGKRKKPA